MLLFENKLYSLQDVCLLPCVTTDINSRSECSCFCENLEGTSNVFLPLIASPMSCVLDETNYLMFLENGINCIIPRTVSLELRKKFGKTMFTAFGMDEVDSMIKSGEIKDQNYILIDVANGHMQRIFDMGKTIKDIKPEIKLMGGNIANPATYVHYDLAGFDYVRVSIGTGNGCLSSVQTAVHYPMASLLHAIPKEENSVCKIIADGGMNCYSDIIKAIALGADYVMCGMIFAKAARTPEEIGQDVRYYGMSTKEAQRMMGKTELKTSEGKFLDLKKEYTLSGWTENFVSYLKSAMSYCDSRDLNEFREKSVLQVMSNETIKTIRSK